MQKSDWERFYTAELRSFVDEEYSNHTCFPPREKIFNALEMCSEYCRAGGNPGGAAGGDACGSAGSATAKAAAPTQVKCVILGQDPYHDDGQAMGLAFSVPSGVKLPPSLRNIYKEIGLELDRSTQNCDGNLTSWAMQGVLLLNSVLTVRAHAPGSHRGHGWEEFTDNVIRLLDEDVSPKVFMLWGSDAIKKQKLITNEKHLVLTAAHPSPLSAYRGFFGCGHFAKCNEYLVCNGVTPIEW